MALLRIKLSTMKAHDGSDLDGIVISSGCAHSHRNSPEVPANQNNLPGHTRSSLLVRHCPMSR